MCRGLGFEMLTVSAGRSLQVADKLASIPLSSVRALNASTGTRTTTTAQGPLLGVVHSFQKALWLDNRDSGRESACKCTGSCSSRNSQALQCRGLFKWLCVVCVCVYLSKDGRELV